MCDIAILWSTTVYTCGPVLIKYLPSQHEMLTQCWGTVWPASQTLTQQYPNIGSTSRVCWLIGLSTTKSVTMVLSDARVPVCLSSYKLMDAREPSRPYGLILPIVDRIK